MSQNDFFLAHLSSQACPHCGQSRTWEFEAMLGMHLNTSAGHAIAEPEWDAQGAAFVEHLFKISCGGCRHMTWLRDDATEGCPVCFTPGGLRDALEQPSRVPMPERCSCGSAHLRTRVEQRVIVRVDDGTAEPWQPVAAGSPGYHVVHVSCLACGREVVAAPGTCGACGSDPAGQDLRAAR